jgi:DNA-binding transcriptional LysR family regulator
VARLATIDVNLLVALDALLEECHVSRAALRVGLSQSAMSHALTRLRSLLDDPLLVRSGRAMTLTPRARAMARPLAEALAALERAVVPAPQFDPKNLERDFRLAAIDFAELVLVPRLSADLLLEAPSAGLTIVSPVEPVARAVADGSVDIAVGLARDAPGLRQQLLLEERFVCVARRGHPATKQKLTPRRFAALHHALVSPRGRSWGAVDAALRELGLSRRVALTAPHALTAALVVARTDLVLTIAERVARIALRGLPLVSLEPPVGLKPFALTMLWHPRNDADPGHAFVRESLARVAARTPPTRPGSK